ncbi:hypothetical protein NDU88_006796 [Pleurodeles waltl]|uniref:Uncharacterized protein n=1 Tax=Pleurodeles waltl TaxID=8319 RepID=A0AAV7QIY1_PLEWA|nr:hypothetical protein NDU88_006796 [Pleurodeles waltl]
MVSQESADLHNESSESMSNEDVLSDTAYPSVPVLTESAVPFMSTSLSLDPTPGSVLLANNPDSSIEKAFLALSKDIKRGFAISENNQGEIREACGALEKKLDLLVLRTRALEESLEVMKDEIRVHKEEINTLKENDQTLQNKLEQLETNSGRNDLRVLNIPK